MALMRYPGSKAKIVSQIMMCFPEEMTFPLRSHIDPWEYREPFFGAGAIGIDVLKNLSPRCRVWINDLDPHVASLWRAVKENPDELIYEFRRLKISSDLFFQLKSEDGLLGISDAEAGARKMALHAMSRSGFGVKAGGPIGGKHQNNPNYDVLCRWNPEAREREVKRLHKLLGSFDKLKITCEDFATVFVGSPEKCFIYVDPPYYHAGPQLYKHAMSDADHERLASVLRQSQSDWVLSYDNHPRIAELYKWAEIKKVSVVYTCAKPNGGGYRVNDEIVIRPEQSMVSI